MLLSLVTISDRGDVIGAGLELAVGPPAPNLCRNAGILLELNSARSCVGATGPDPIRQSAAFRMTQSTPILARQSGSTSSSEQNNTPSYQQSLHLTEEELEYLRLVRS